MYIVINAENASLKSSDKFTLPNNKARLCVLKSLIESGLEASQVARSFGGHNNGATCRLGSGNNTDTKHMSERPKSAGAVTTSTTTSTTAIPVKSSSNILEQQHVTTNETLSRSITPELPSEPSISRSSVLRELKSLTRRKSSNSHSGSNNHNGKTKFHSYHHHHPHSTISEDNNEKQGKNDTVMICSLKLTFPRQLLD